MSNVWISVDTELPEDDGRYAVVVFNPNLTGQEPWTECTNYLCGIWLKMFHCKVIYWAKLPPLPSPPDTGEK